MKDIHPTAQMPLFQTEDPVLAELKELDLNNLNPIEALNLLFEWRKRIL